MAFFGPLKLSEANAPSTNALPGQTGYTAYPAGQQFRIGGQSPGQDYIGLIAQELGKRFQGMSGLTSFAGPSLPGVRTPGGDSGLAYLQGTGGGTSALGFSWDNPQGNGALEGIGGVTPESLTALLSGEGAPQTIEELITRVPPGVRSGVAGQATGPSQAGQSSMSPGRLDVTGPNNELVYFQGGSVGEDPGGQGAFGDPSGATPGQGDFSGFGPGMNATAAGITGGILGGAMGLAGGTVPGGVLGAIGGYNTGQNLAEAVNARGEFGLVSTLGMGRATGAMDDPTAQGALTAPEGIFSGVAPSGPTSSEAPAAAPSGDTPGGQAGEADTGGAGPSGNAAGDTGGQAGAESGGGEGPAPDSGSSSVICTHLFRHGYMSRTVFEADTYFGKTLDPHIYHGYMTWAPTVVGIMKRFPKTVPLVAVIARPWANEMAYQMGSLGRGSIIGKIMMKIGVAICDRIGRRLQARESVSSV